MGKRVHIRIQDLAAAIKHDVNEVHRRTVVATHLTAAEGVDIAYINAPVAFGEVREGLIATAGADGAKVVSTAPYSAAVEVGSRPHMPPLAPIMEWVRLRGMQGLDYGKNAFGHNRVIKNMLKAHEQTEYRGVEGKDGEVRFKKAVFMEITALREVAMRIALGIKKNGTKPTWFMRKTAKQMGPLLHGFIRQGLEEI